jgi:hypothetical protein
MKKVEFKMKGSGYLYWLASDDDASENYPPLFPEEPVS